MKREYHAEFYEWHGGGTSLHNVGGVSELLNQRASVGWELTHALPTTLGFMFIFTRGEWSQK